MILIYGETGNIFYMWCCAGETERITKCRGRVLALRDESHVLRVWLPDKDTPGLAMSRAFGDFMLKNYGIIAIPDVTYHRITPSDEFLVLATDGVTRPFSYFC